MAEAFPGGYGIRLYTEGRCLHRLGKSVLPWSNNARPCNPIKKTAARSGIVPGRAAVILILLHQPTHQLCIGNGVLNGQTGDQQGLVIEQLGVLGDLVGVARGVGSFQSGKDRVVRVQL